MKNKDDNDDIVYYPQVLIEQCRHRVFSNNKIIHPEVVLQTLSLMNLKKSLMKILCVMNKNNNLITTIF